MKLPKKFLSRIAAKGGCWVWLGYCNRDGYGRHGAGLAHRYSYAAVHGGIPPKMLVLHRCDNPPCVRPSHLFLGTAADNSKDMMVKGRSKKGRPNPFAPKGSDHGMSRLQAPDVWEIRRLCLSGVTQRKVAKLYQISFQHVSDIVNRKRWAHI